MAGLETRGEPAHPAVEISGPWKGQLCLSLIIQPPGDPGALGSQGAAPGESSVSAWFCH